MFPELYILRHGETEWNRQHRWQGALDSPLTDKGIEQARAMGAFLADRGVAVDRFDLISSPQGRALRTAELAFGAGRARTDPRLREIGVGEFAGLTRTEILDRIGGGSEPGHFLDLYEAAPGRESFDSLFSRVREVLSELAHPTIIVTHGITSRFLRTAAMGWGLDRVRELPGGQGVVHHIHEGRHQTLAASGS